MNSQQLVRMANDIANFFRSEPDRQDAVQGIAAHIQRFWEPRMRRQILEHVQHTGSELDELVREALSHVSAPPA